MSPGQMIFPSLSFFAMRARPLRDPFRVRYVRFGLKMNVPTFVIERSHSLLPIHRFPKGHILLVHVFEVDQTEHTIKKNGSRTNGNPAVSHPTVNGRAVLCP